MNLLSRIFKKSDLSLSRTTRRVPIRIPFVVYGRDEGGFQFRTAAETSVVTGEGGCLVLDKDVCEGQNLKLCDRAGKVFLVNVRSFQYDGTADRRLVGFRVVDPTRDWALNVVNHLRYNGLNLNQYER